MIGKNYNVGNRAAENDTNFLMNCFVETDAFDEVLDIDNPRSVLLGRTGAGKTAIIEYIKRTRPNVYEFDVGAMAFGYIANNTSVLSLEKEGVDLGLFYQILWKHALCLELIQRRWRIRGRKTKRTF